MSEEKPKLLVNHFAGQNPGMSHCTCTHQEVRGPREFHHERTDPKSEAWQMLEALIQKACEDERETFAPSAEMPAELWLQLTTLPSSIGRLTNVRTLNLYGSSLVAIPPDIAGMRSLETFTPYTSRQLHWFPYEITRCSQLRSSTVSTRELYGNFKTRIPFPALPARIPESSVASACSVCNAPFTTPAVLRWISLRVATDVLPLLVQACSTNCLSRLPTPPEGYVQRAHTGGPTLAQPPRR